VQNDLMVVAVLFVCSLAAAIVLFAILKSEAIIKKKESQVGGAAAGFLLIYSMLYGSYYQIQKLQVAACQALLEDVTVQGSIDPPEQAVVILGRDSFPTDSNGRFLIKTKGTPQSVYVINHERSVSHTIFPGEDLKDLKIP